MINARSETITDKPSFRASTAKHRCLLPADGYDEWQKLDEAGRHKHWLSPSITDKADVRAMVEASEPLLIPHPVGKAVGSIRNNGPQLTEPM